MSHRLHWTLCAALLAVYLGACGGHHGPDAGALPCQAPPDCKLAGFDGACRNGICASNVPCADDVECGLGEACTGGQCRFTGCTSNADCPIGTCRMDSYACTQCGQDSDCPAPTPVCNASGACAQCRVDSDCPAPGPAICDTPSGTCVQCTQDVECPNGLTCGADRLCHGVALGASCSGTLACDTGLVCVTVNGANSECLSGCDLYTPSCPSGDICYKLGFTDSSSLVFDNGAPLGVCSPPLAGLKAYGQPCSVQAGCEPNLVCVPDSSTAASCHAYCDPKNPSCAAGQSCHGFPGDFDGHRYGLCYADDGWGAACTGDAQCDAGLACTPMDDPSTFTGLSDFCTFDVGALPALSPCDAGAMPSSCASGYCLAEDVFGTGSSAASCFGACATDSDCNPDGGHVGACLGLVDFSSSFVSGVPMGACLPWCPSDSACVGYGSALACRLAVIAAPQTGMPALLQTCDGPGGPSAAGTPCDAGADCWSGECLALDARGISRQGVCLSPCASPADCAALPDAGPADAGTLACGPDVLLGGAGIDGVVGTADDVDFTTSVCLGGACGDDTACAAPFSRCTVDPAPSNPKHALVLGCRAPAIPGFLEGGAACALDADCASGACAQLQPPSTGSGRACLAPCVAATTACDAGLTCRVGGAALAAPDGTLQTFDSCAP